MQAADYYFLLNFFTIRATEAASTVAKRSSAEPNSIGAVYCAHVGWMVMQHLGTYRLL
jgi:hypothetical protein